MTLRLNGSTSGYTEIDAPASAGNNTLVLPTGNGTAGNILGTDGSGNLSWVGGRLAQGNSQATTSGTVVEFTGIPFWAKRITLSVSGLSTSGTSRVIVQIGAGSYLASGYSGGAAIIAASTSAVNSSTGFLLDGFAVATNVRHGAMSLILTGSNLWVSSCLTGLSDSAYVGISGGSATLAGALDRIRLTTVNGTDTFDAGTANILYEG